MVHHLLETGQVNHNLHATQKESRAQSVQITAVEYISDTEEIVKASPALFHHDGAAALKLSERSSWPPAVSAKDLPGGLTQKLSVCQIRQTNHHLIKCNADIAPESI